MAKMADVLETLEPKRKVECAEKLSSDCYENVPGGVVFFLPDESQLFVPTNELALAKKRRLSRENQA